jgi:hypothetical protein
MSGSAVGLFNNDIHRQLKEINVQCAISKCSWYTLFLTEGTDSQHGDGVRQTSHLSADKETGVYK